MIPTLALLIGLWTGAGAVGPVTGLSILPASERTEVVISVSGDVETRDFTMEGPHRLIVDLMGARHALPQDNFYDIDRGGVRAIRTSQYSADIVRVVLELDEQVGYQLMQLEGQIRLTLENRNGAFEPWSSSGASPAPERAAVSAATIGGATAGAEPTSAASRSSEPPADTRAGSVSRSRSHRTGGSGFAVQDFQDARRITVSFVDTPIEDVLFTFAEFADRSIVPGSEVEGQVTAEIRDQPWDEAMRTILEAHGLSAVELESGIIRVDALERLSARDSLGPVQTQAFRISYVEAQEMQDAVQSLMTARGNMSVAEGTNTLLVTDVPRVLDAVEEVLDQLDIRTPQVAISARIIFVNRTQLDEFGITYDLKDSQGNQLNQTAPGAADLNGDGTLETVPTGTNVVTLGGNSIAALGNANARVVGPSLSLLTSLVIGRHTLVSFIEALESENLSDVQATPTLTVLDNKTARIMVGEETPVRVIDAGGVSAGEGATQPQATVQFQETGIILEVTPHITAEGDVLMRLHAERSSAEVAESDAGFIFRTQEAQTEVLVADGETIVIAGLTITDHSESRTGIPLLMDLPLVGRLFRVTRQREEQRDLMILVTPEIVRGDLR